MKKIAVLLLALSTLGSSMDLSAQAPYTIPTSQPVNRPRAQRSGQQAGVSGAAIAAGIGIIVAIAAVALISNNAHSH
jgi:hypothetical protein